jgi:redox-sensing transcriptional repressor
MNLPAKTVERLSEYRRSLLHCLSQGKDFIFSHELAALHHFTAVQVRRDIMLIGHGSYQRKGYNVRDLIKKIGKILDTEQGQNVAVIGLGHLGKAITNYFRGKRSKLNIVATFDIDPEKVNKSFAGVRCFPVEKMEDVIRQKNINIAVITAPPEVAREVTKRLVKAGIRGILNYSSVPLNVPDDIFLEGYDFITSLEKVAYFAKSNRRKKS